MAIKLRYSMVFNVSRLIGPAVAGVIISWVGEAWCFAINAISYALIAWTLILMRIKKTNLKRPLKERKVFQELKSGWQYITQHQTLKSLLVLLACVSFCNVSIKTLGPVFAKDILQGDADTFGMLMSAVAVGAIGGALFLSKGRKVPLLFKIITYTAPVLGISMIVFSLSRWLPLSLFVLSFCGLARMMHTTTTNTLLQIETEDDKRRRVMSFYTVCIQGTNPVGGLAVGSLASAIGGTWAMLSMGVICVIAGAFYQGRKLWGKRLRNRLNT